MAKETADLARSEFAPDPSRRIPAVEFRERQRRPLHARDARQLKADPLRLTLHELTPHHRAIQVDEIARDIQSWHQPRERVAMIGPVFSITR